MTEKQLGEGMQSTSSQLRDFKAQRQGSVPGQLFWHYNGQLMAELRRSSGLEQVAASFKTTIFNCCAAAHWYATEFFKTCNT